MLSNEYLKTARTLQRAALEMTDRLVVHQLRALAEDYERRSKKAAQADATAQEGLNWSFPKSRSSARLQAARAARLAERTLEKIEDQQPRCKSALSASSN